MIKSPTQAAAVLNTMRGTPMPAWTPYASLSVGGVEFTAATAPGYSRVPLTMGPPSANQSAIAVQAAFPTPTTADWPTATELVIMDAQTGGSTRYTWDMVAAGVAAADRTALVGRPLLLPVGGFIVEEV